MSKLNPYNLKRLIHTFGVRNRDIVPSVSLCLGPCEISVGEMVSAYTAFPNKYPGSSAVRDPHRGQ